MSAGQGGMMEVAKSILIVCRVVVGEIEAVKGDEDRELQLTAHSAIKVMSP